MITSIQSFNELSTQDLYDILQLRNAIFIVEQQCPYQDLDYKDQQALHLCIREEETLLAYARILPDYEADTLSFGRIVTATVARGQGLGKQLLNNVMDYLQTHFAGKMVHIHAQFYLKRFYESYGFWSEGEPFDEDGIPHILMVRSL
ncbi:GNAT family N-acetyltransferase [Legionella quinlivanii]|uniref:GNAT family N-acetyltransferase n=1 Tax=Legionella quinlivanii TaxID=45073 RepID=UPI00224346BE|nr:GNAT family N-acetyltransferase [Legionella quinlivanii]MCW8451915.1 GNAT family N-acetyltransferase [Legionella quinlivanii]